MFQLILPFQLELPFDGPELARGGPGKARVRRARVRGRKGSSLDELGQVEVAPALEFCSRADPRA